MLYTLTKLVHVRLPMKISEIRHRLQYSWGLIKTVYTLALLTNHELKECLLLALLVAN